MRRIGLRPAVTAITTVSTATLTTTLCIARAPPKIASTAAGSTDPTINKR